VTASVIGGSSAQHGGGIASHAPGVLAILDSRVSGNSASGNGGGVYGTGAVTVSGSLIASNDSGGGAGGIDVSGEGSLTLDTTTLSGNSGIGGGAFWAAGTVRASLVSGNTASFGGGIAVPFGRVLDVTNSTVSGNTVVSDGGGIYCGGTLSLSNVTVADNVADVDESSAGNGGGIFNLLGTVILRNTIVAANADRGGEAPDCSGPLTSAGHNLIETTAGCSVGGDTTGNLTGIGAGLDLLTDNGGPTATHALLAGSPAIDAGNPAGCTDQAGFLLITDQRGLGRVAGAACDVGALELGAVPPTTSTTSTTTSTAVPTTATTTTRPAECDAGSPAACDDAEPCTADTCSAGRCVHEPAPGAAAARCVCQRPEPPECAADAVPARLSRRFGWACHLLERAAAARRHGLARRLVGRAIAKDRAARRLAGRAGERTTIGGACGRPARAHHTDAEARVLGRDGL
jgi:predicted outer membrane repeat protein